MKRDMEVIIETLKFIEENNENNPKLVIKLDNQEFGLVQYNVGLMFEHGLIHATPVKVSGSRVVEYLVKGLTWEGHEFLDSVRNDNVLEKAKSLAKEKGSKLFDLPFEIIKGLAVKAAQSYFLG
ncbi:DUF2513 domain-containing protein [Paenibacillus macquariensis]|uniref:DUF2513 domain-containing protein n=1 Tax=Paenibacillus macquariensis TaxID=948756 RepID=A0ABY1JKE4_9BACL|nr:DUF2513 domain-containing protein [Paenibacillus macquariensis]MEC0089914.1 DUF2513 domain-containing protein [Paenibacillus macquariensis]OAB31194.1 hypothetical protein PMSM_20970 [Paenibacillus macquariensis subsp. macquariensis]SIQ34172.1 Hypothetical protein SAMN05421578_101300 [Paenibacillus macquariensis]